MMVGHKTTVLRFKAMHPSKVGWMNMRWSTEDSTVCSGSSCQHGSWKLWSVLYFIVNINRADQECLTLDLPLTQGTFTKSLLVYRRWTD